MHGLFNDDRPIDMKQTIINNTRDIRTSVENHNVISNLYLDSKETPYTIDLQILKKAPIITKWVASRYNKKNNTR